MAEAAERLRPLIAKRGQLKAQITRFLSFLNNVENNDNIRLKLEITTRLEKIELVWDQFSNIQSDIEILDDSDAQRKEGEFFEEQYFSVVSKAKELLAEFQETKTNANTDQSVNYSRKNVHLPTLTLPKFHGQYEGWQSFHDAFEALVNRDKSLSNTQKFMYLNSCLEGEAASITESLIVTDDNYVIAWDLLKNRYENKRAILNAHINALLDLPVIVKESHLGLRKLIDTFLKNMRALKKFRFTNRYMGSVINQHFNQKIRQPYETRMGKINQAERNPKQSLESQNKSLNVKSNTCGTENTRLANNNRSFNRNSETKTLAHVTTENASVQCNFCKGTHLIYRCRDFLKLTAKLRFKEVKRLNLCTNCLRTDHTVSDCKSGSCRVCAKKHNSLLHFDEVDTTKGNQGQQPSNTVSQTESVSQTNQLDSNQERSVNTHCSVPRQSYVLLSTAIVQLEGNKGNKITCRALLDSGSQSNFIVSNLAQRLGTRITKINWPVTGINQSTTNIHSRTEACVKSPLNGYSKNLSFLILDKITQNIPTISFDLSKLDIPSDITLADPDFSKSAPIDVLLGAEIFFDILCVGQIKLGLNKPILQKSHVGWIVSGPVFSGQL
ncbi:hypothetical protein NQ318_018013 [Aromia moschata]|uniref:Peptidase aspartic putative domain-containing protein n=1 Tax=Aromia moschata TaxID=1265417 RepID=A0AAV8Y9T4_9CUCU|nr:hypothetical protein NQ318_018013 [Aromia moschata]